MGFFTKKQVKLSAVVFNFNDFEELNYNQLVEVNGGCGGGFWAGVRNFFSGGKNSSGNSGSASGSSSASRSSSSYSGGTSSASASSITSSSYGGCGGGVILSRNNQEKIKTLHPEIRNATSSMLTNLKKDNVNVEISLATRTYEEQDRLYSKGRNEKGEIIDESKVVTYAKGGQSYHNFGLAFDVEVYNENGTKYWNKQSEAWQKVINEGKKQGFLAGAEWNDFPDLPHFENSFGNTQSALRYNIQNNKMKDGYVTVK